MQAAACRRPFGGGAIIGALGGLTGLGGAEFLLPLLIGEFRFAALQAVILNLLAGSLLGAWFGAGWATRLASQMIYRVIAGLLLGIAVVLIFGHNAAATGAMLTGPAQMVGVIAGFVIGVVAALLGVAGGELLIPTLVPSVKVIM